MNICLFLWLYQLIVALALMSRPVLGKIHLQVHFYFPHYIPVYSAAGLGFWLPAWDDFHSSKLANQTLGWPQLTLSQKRRQINPYELCNTISQYIA